MRQIVFLLVPALLLGCAAPEDKRPKPHTLSCVAISEEYHALSESVEARERAENIQSAIEITTMLLTLVAGGGNLGGNNYGGDRDTQLPMDRERLQKLDEAFISKKCAHKSTLGQNIKNPT